MDGNGRWAKSKGLSRTQGHAQGVESARTVVEECRRLGVEHLTLYTFSKENWSRPKEEIRFLFDLLIKFLNNELTNLLEQDIRLQQVGDPDGLPLPARETIKLVCAKTRHCSSMTVNLALNYSGRDEIIEACKRLMRSGVSPNAVDETAFEAALYTAGTPDPDLIVRTSGEIRLSNFLLYQAAYSELYFTETYWPDFGKEELHTALAEYCRRKRRFGKTDEQLETTAATVSDGAGG